MYITMGTVGIRKIVRMSNWRHKLCKSGKLRGVAKGLMVRKYSTTVTCSKVFFFKVMCCKMKIFIITADSRKFTNDHWIRINYKSFLYFSALSFFLIFELKTQNTMFGTLSLQNYLWNYCVLSIYPSCRQLYDNCFVFRSTDEYVLY